MLIQSLSEMFCTGYRAGLKFEYVNSTTRSLDQILENLCELHEGHSFNPVFMELCPNVYLHRV